MGGSSAARKSLVGAFVTANTKRETVREVREIIEGQTKRESHRSGKRHFMWCEDGGRGGGGVGGGGGEASLKFLDRPLALPIGVA